MAVNPNIKKKADDIRNKVYGKEVRESLASGLEEMSSDVVENESRQSVVEGRQDSVESQFQNLIDETTGKDVISAPEIIAARGNHDNLSQRLLSTDQQLAQKASKDELNALGELKFSGEYNTLSDLQTAYPNGADGVFLVIDDGFVYRWNGTEWTQSVQFQSTGIASESITPDKIKGLIPTGNLLSPEKIIDGAYAYLDDASGTLHTEENVDYAYIILKAKKNTKYSFTMGRFVNELEANQTTVINELQSATEIVTTDRTEYLAVSIKKIDYPLDTYMIVEGEMPVEYNEPTYKISWLDTPKIDEKSNLPLINLTPELPALVGKELNVFYKNLTQANLNRYNIAISVGGKGKHLNNKFTFTPTVAENRTITFKFYDENGEYVTESTSNLNIKDSNVGSGITKSMLLIGDSTVRSNGTGDITQRLLDNFSTDVMDITLLGTMGTAPNLWEGRGGWTAARYRTGDSYNGVPNPFYNSTISDFDFAYYMNQQGYSDVDYVVIQSGINEMFYAKNDMELSAEIQKTLNDYDALVNSIKTFNTNTKIGINVTIPPNDSQDAFGESYGTYDTQWRYKRNNALWVNKLIEHYSDDVNVSLIPVHVGIDTVNNIADGVHPKLAGYNQIGDVVYYWLKSFEV